jgi:hypothetical protein
VEDMGEPSTVERLPPLAENTTSLAEGVTDNVGSSSLSLQDITVAIAATVSAMAVNLKNLFFILLLFKKLLLKKLTIKKLLLKNYLLLYLLYLLSIRLMMINIPGFPLNWN